MELILFLLYCINIRGTGTIVCRGDQSIKINCVVKNGGDQYIGGPPIF